MPRDQVKVSHDRSVHTKSFLHLASAHYHYTLLSSTPVVPMNNVFAQMTDLRCKQICSSSKNINSRKICSNAAPVTMAVLGNIFHIWFMMRSIWCITAGSQLHRIIIWNLRWFFQNCKKFGHYFVDITNPFQSIPTSYNNLYGPIAEEIVHSCCEGPLWFKKGTAGLYRSKRCSICWVTTTVVIIFSNAIGISSFARKFLIWCYLI